MPRSTRFADAATLIGVITTYFVAGKLGLALAFVNASASAVWPPTGIALAALLIFGPRAWPGIFLGAFLVNETTAGSIATSLAIAAGNTGEALVGAYLVSRFANGQAAFDRGQDFFSFGLLAGLLSTAISASVGVTSLSLAGFVSSQDYGSVWLTWWLGDAAGAIVVTPAVVLWKRDRHVRWSRTQRFEILGFVAALTATGWVAFFAVTSPLAFLVIPLCVWAGFRFGQRGAATATCLLSILAVCGTVRGLGSFGSYPPNEALLILQVFMAVTTVVGISVGAAVAERRRSEEQVRLLNETLEQRVGARTIALERALDGLRASEARLEDAQEIAHTGSWEWTLAENRVWWSKEMSRIYGTDRASYDAFFAVVHPDDRERVKRIAQRALADGQAFEYEHRIVRSDREVRTLYGKGRVVLDDRQQAVRILGTAQDITERKRLEAQILQAQKRETLGRLVSGVAHDFNNVLTAIRCYTDVVLQSFDEANPQRADLLEVRRAAERASALTRQLLIFSQRQALEPQVVDLNAVIQVIEPMLRRLIGDNVVITTALAPDVRGIRADVSHIEQVLMNLVVNARDAMPSGGQLTMETRNVVLDGRYGFAKPVHPAAGSYVLLTVSDTGCGMDDLVKSHAFEPFFTTKEPGQGTGLGLATVDALVKRSGGRVCVYSELGRGTTFKLYFPADVVPAPLPAPSSADSATEVASGAETVLLVEDDEDVRRVARAALHARGYTVLEASNGNDAQRLAVEFAEHIDLVLTDVVMPGLDGPGLAAQLQTGRPALRVLFISGYPERATRQQRLVPDGMPFLEKPFTPAQLLQKVRAVLDAEPSIA